MTKKIISILALAFAIATPALNVNTHAQSNVSAYRVVTATNGLNVRDKNCKRIETIGYGTTGWTNDNSNPPINCTINGKSVKMVYLQYNVPSSEGYVAELFLASITSKDFDYNNSIAGEESTYPKLKVNATSGLNLRDGNCKRVTTLSNGTRLSAYGHTDYMPICKVGKIYHQMVRVIYKGNIFFVASTFVDQIK
jgi:hypothetical protein